MSLTSAFTADRATSALFEPLLFNSIAEAESFLGDRILETDSVVADKYRIREVTPVKVCK